MTDNLEQTTGRKSRKKYNVPLVPCEGFHGVYKRAGAKGDKFLARIAAPGGCVIYIGTYEHSGKAAEAYDNVARHFMANKPEAIRFAPSLNWPGISEVPLPSKKAIDLLPKFAVACDNHTRARAAAKSPDAIPRGRKPVRPLVGFHLLTLRDCLMTWVRLHPEDKEPLLNFSASLQALLKCFSIAADAKTPANPDIEAFNASLAKMNSELKIREGLAELQGDIAQRARPEPNTDKFLPATLTPGDA